MDNKFFHKKFLGQHFIKDAKLHQKIASRGMEIANYNIVEIGPGDGGLSKAILEQNPKKLILIEKDKDLIPHLQKIFQEQSNENHKVEIMNCDGTQIDIRKITEQPVKIIANLPYNVATNMILNWLEYANFFESITVLIQKEVADRFLAKVGDSGYGRTAILTNLVSDVKKEFNVPPKAFNPPPKVDSTLITFRPFKNNKYDISWKELSSLTKIAFAQPRKTITNNLKGQYAPITQILEELQINPNSRPENLYLSDFYNIFTKLKQL
jgi:16S rRNA (adenine1518-N6/adenine1519-N6)-dimethyltransferase